MNDLGDEKDERLKDEEEEEATVTQEEEKALESKEEKVEEPVEEMKEGAEGKEEEKKEPEPEEVKKEKKAKKVKKKKKKERMEELEIVERLPKKKPQISADIKKLIAIRREQKSKKPEFLRQEWFRYGKLGLKWRRPRGMHSKMRRHYKRRINVVSIGYGSPSSIRYYHPSGFQEKLVHNVDELEGIN
ncbi:MAG: hypothetical protein KAI64_01035, partial [Thermoplasmata archaeon]|nr:hypothetical protein [Thermoplasmata archaeon]